MVFRAIRTPKHAENWRRLGGRTVAIALACLLCAALAWPALWVSAADNPPQSASSMRMVTAMLGKEDAAAQHKDYYAYISNERSSRTGGHLWTEKVVETNAGKVRFLLAEDGQPLSPEREAQERGRLAAIVADPAGFARKSQAAKNDEIRMQQLLARVSQAYLFSEPRDEGDLVRIDFHPDPNFQTQSMEERVLHGASGRMLIDPKAMRLHEIEARLPQDVTIGFGLVTTIRAGSNFKTTREATGMGSDWKTTTLDTDLDGRAILFKSLSQKQHSEHSAFVRVPDDISVAQAVALAEQP